VPGLRRDHRAVRLVLQMPELRRDDRLQLSKKTAVA